MEKKEKKSNRSSIFSRVYPFKWRGIETLPQKGETKQKRISGPLLKKDNRGLF